MRFQGVAYNKSYVAVAEPSTAFASGTRRASRCGKSSLQRGYSAALVDSNTARCHMQSCATATYVKCQFREWSSTHCGWFRVSVQLERLRHLQAARQHSQQGRGRRGGSISLYFKAVASERPVLSLEQVSAFVSRGFAVRCATHGARPRQFALCQVPRLARVLFA